MAVLPESMDRLDKENVEKSFSTLENYIRYMGERIEFSMRNVTRNVSEAGISSAELYLLVTELRDNLAALQSTVNGLSGSVTSIQGSITEIQGSISSLDERVKALESKESGS